MTAFGAPCLVELKKIASVSQNCHTIAIMSSSSLTVTRLHRVWKFCRNIQQFIDVNERSTLSTVATAKSLTVADDVPYNCTGDTYGHL